MAAVIGTREWVIDAHNNLPGENIAPEQPSSTRQILIQGKKLSRIICFIWSNEDPETAGKLDLIFKSGKLKKLLFAHSGSPSDEYNLLLKIFKPEDLPIFDIADLDSIDFQVETNTFQGGSINDPSVLSPVPKIIIPYPPCPTIVDDTQVAMSGYAPIKKSELKDWMQQSPNALPFYPSNPYIPTTCS